MRQINKLHRKLLKHQKEVENTLDALLLELEPNIEFKFEFRREFVSGEYIIIPTGCNVEHHLDYIYLRECIKWIRTHGKLTLEDYLSFGNEFLSEEYNTNEKNETNE